jgi:hypothetical protein
MDVHGLARITLVGVEEEPERFVAENNWHGTQFTRQRAFGVKPVFGLRGICAN